MSDTSRAIEKAAKHFGRIADALESLVAQGEAKAEVKAEVKAEGEPGCSLAPGCIYFEGHVPYGCRDKYGDKLESHAEAPPHCLLAASCIYTDKCPDGCRANISEGQ